jgi:hypothetical protein
MDDLLSLEARRRILAAYRDHISAEDVNLIFWLFHCGCGFPEGFLGTQCIVPGGRRWRDAEHFLEILDGARHDRASLSVVVEVFDRLKYHTNGQLRPDEAFRRDPMPTEYVLAPMARRVAAASCCTFLEGVDGPSARRKERWLPYQAWLRRLAQYDTILTFNYDLVVEMLQPAMGEPMAIGVLTHGVRVRGPDHDAPNARDQQERPWLYKLHGSVNWKRDENGDQLLSEGWTPAMLGSGYDLAIATPGDSKIEMSGGVFGRLWNEAAEALVAADDVFIIGFRFPPSDALPREKLLRALQQNQKKSLNVHVVLGPELNAERRRAIALLEWTLGLSAKVGGRGNTRARELSSPDMWAEDFLSVWSQREANSDKG